MKIPCYYALSCIDYKFGYVTTCPRQTDRLIVDEFLPSKIINSESFKLMRKDLASGIWPKGCWSCKESEQKNVLSMRNDFPVLEDGKFFRQQNEKPILDFFDKTTGEIDPSTVEHVEMRLSKSCNFTCFHCSTAYSSGWINLLKNYEPDSDDFRYELDQFFKPGINEYIRYSDEQIDSIVEDLNKNFKNLSKIQFAGGELLHQKKFFDVLKKFNDHPNAENIELTFHTNFNANFDVVELSELLKKFKKSIIIISIDGGKNIYSYFRSGTWNKLNENIKLFKKNNNESELIGSCTTSIYQIMDIENIIDSFSELELDEYNASIVQVPRYLNPSLLNHDFKKYVFDDLETTYDYTRGNKSLIKTINFIKKYVYNNNFDYRYFNAFKVFSKKIDKLTNKSFNDHFKKYKIMENNLVRNGI